MSHGGRDRLVLVLLCSAQLCNVISLSSVNIALPDIARDLGFSEPARAWIVSAYALAFGGSLLVAGRAADLFGRRRILVAGCSVFAAATLLDALATTPGMLIAARTVQGVGAATMVPAALGLLTSHFVSPAERSRAVAAFGAAGAVGFAAGLVLGGAVTEAVGWRWVFALTIPLVLAVIVGVLALVTPDSPGSRARGRIDVAGASIATVGLVALGFGLNRAATAGFGAPESWMALGASVVLLGVLAAVEARVRDPLIPLGVWGLPDLTATLAIAFCVYAAWLGMTFFVALTLQEALGYEPTEAAVALLPLAAGAHLGSTAAGRLLPRCGPRVLLVGGTALFATGLAITATIDAGSSYWPRILIAVLASSLGLSVTFVTCNVLALAHAPPEDESLVGGLFATVAQGVAGGVGVAVAAAVAALRTEAGAMGAALVPGYQAAFWTATGLAVAGLLLAAGPFGPRRRHACPAGPCRHARPPGRCGRIPSQQRRGDRGSGR